MICDGCEYCTKIVTEKGSDVSCRIVDKQQMEYNILNNRCITWTPKKIKKHRKK